MLRFNISPPRHYLYRVRDLAPWLTLAWWGQIRKVVVLFQRWYVGVERVEEYGRARLSLVFGEVEIVER